MNRLDFTDLNRFLVSLGLIFYVFTFTIPWLFFKDSVGNQIKISDYGLLTEKSKSLIERNQDYLLIISNSIPWISIILFSFGTFFIVYGIIRWFKKQKRIDEREELELTELRRNVRTLNEEQKVEKAKKEVKLEFQDKVENNENEKPITEHEIKSEDWKNVINIENQIIEKIKLDNPLNYEIKTNVVIENIVADIVLQSYTKEKQDRIIEIKYFQHKLNFQTLVGVLHNMKFFTNIYCSLFKKSVTGLLIIVYNEEISNQIKIKELDGLIAKYISQNGYDFISYKICKTTEVEELKFDEFY